MPTSLGSALADIKIAHTLFALPMALTGMLLATRGELPAPRILVLIVICMVTGRSAAMGLNRLLDAELDARNPRTRNREIPSGRLSRRAMAIFVGANAAGFLLGAALLNRLTLLLAPIALGLFVLYPYTKRFTALCHFVLGACLGAAPVGAWIAVRGRIEPEPLLLGLAVLLWVSGFDTLYALQDLEFDRDQGLRSIPAAWGPHRARLLARLLHGGMLAALAGLGWVLGLGAFYYAGVLGAAVLLAASHWLVREGIERIHVAFFTMNSWLSVVVLVATLLDLTLQA